MSEQHQPENVDVNNELSLQKLSWTIQATVGQFKLILARCNYAQLRDTLISRLTEICPVEISILYLKPSEKTLHTTIREEFGDNVQALMIVGLETLQDLPQMLTSANQVREEFRQSFSFPLVLWVNDEVYTQFMQLAPDLESWATTRNFTLPTNELTNFTKKIATQLFNNTFILTKRNFVEIQSACQELQSSGQLLAAELKAHRDFVWGFVEAINKNFDDAINCYSQSLVFWQESNNLEKQGKILSKITLCSYEKYQEVEVTKSVHSLPKLGNIERLPNSTDAETERVIKDEICQQIKNYLQQTLEVFESANRPDLIADSIAEFGIILRELQDWQQLQVVAERALTVHEAEGNTIKIAKNYGFLAEVALAQEKWQLAQDLAEKALTIISESHQLSSTNLTDVAVNYQYQELKLILSIAQQHLGQLQLAISNLEAAKKLGVLNNEPHLYLNILGKLQKLLYQQKQYLAAFDTKLEARSVEHQFGLRAFIGAGRLQSIKQIKKLDITSLETENQDGIAPEIAASGRQLDVERLVERIDRNDYKLIVIHGQSGVGKSSLVNAGLVPALKNKPIGFKDNLVVAISVYTNWVAELERLLLEALQEVRGSQQVKEQIINEESIIEVSGLDAEVKTPDASSFSKNINHIINQIKANEQYNLRTVLILDQFEEFFFVYTDTQQRRQFFEFLGECLNILSVKVILSLRVDYLYYLLECNRLPGMKIIGNDILSNNVLYELGNFSSTDAKLVIQHLTKTTNFALEADLIDQLVKDLAGELDEVRPIELQIVGSQLQNENIKKLVEYQQRGTKEVLIQSYLDEVINDCGAENQIVARLLLYLLTDEQGTCPSKTRSELERDLRQKLLQELGWNYIHSQNQYSFFNNQLETVYLLLESEENNIVSNFIIFKDISLDMILEIFVKSGLVVLLRDHPKDRYQLVHDYLSFFIRQQQKQQQDPNLKKLIALLAESQEKQRLSEARLNRTLKVALAAAAVAIMGLTVSVINSINSEIKTLSASSETLFASQKGIDALTESLKAGKKLKQTIWVSSQTKEQVLTSLYQAVYGLKERNRLEGHLSGVNSVTFSPDNSLIASASADTTINLWHPDGSLFRNLSGHEDVVNSVSFSPDSQIIISGSQDKTVKLWNRKGDLLNTLTDHSSVVNSAIFSPDGEIIASASTDKTIKLWSREGKLLTTLKGHNSAVLSLAWSTDSKILAAGSADNTVKLWSRDGKLLKNLLGWEDAVKSVTWSPDGKIIAAASLDKNIQLWSREGKLLRTLSGHTSGVTSVSFSRDGQTLASASTDETVKLWSLDGVLLGTLRGHNNWVNSVNFSPDGLTLVSGSRDKTVKIWRWDDVLLRNPKVNYDWVTSISFSPDSRTIAAAGRDKTVKLWSRDGKLLKTFTGHQGQVWGVAWSSDGKTITSASKDTTVKLWSREGKLLKTLPGHKDTVLAVAWSSDGKTIASASKDTTVKLWSREGKLLKTLPGHDQSVNWVSFSPDGKLLASASDDKLVKIWDKDGNFLYDLKGHSRRVNGVTWSPDGQTIASVSIDSTITLWHRDGSLRRTLSGDGDSLISVSFSADGRTLAVNSDDKIRIFSQDGTLLMVLKGDKDELTSVSFSPDSKILAAGSGDGTVVLRSLSETKLDMLLRQGCGLLQDYLHNNPKVIVSDRSLCSH